jgi:6-phosphogluconolactonase
MSVIGWNMKASAVSESSVIQMIKFADRAALADQLVRDIAKQIEACIDNKGYAVCAFSGGSTPELLLAKLGQLKIDWQRVLLTLVDERMVDEGHALSNAAFFKRAISADNPDILNELRFLPLYLPELNDDGAQVANILKRYQDFITQYEDSKTRVNFDVVILGMGNDAHTASFFPDADNIQDLLDANNPNPLLFCESPSTQVRRITWSMPVLIKAQFLALHIHGDDKTKVLNNALANNSLAFPIAMLTEHYSNLKQTALPVYQAD